MNGKRRRRTRATGRVAAYFRERGHPCCGYTRAADGEPPAITCACNRTISLWLAA